MFRAPSVNSILHGVRNAHARLRRLLEVESDPKLRDLGASSTCLDLVAALLPDLGSPKQTANPSSFSFSFAGSMALIPCCSGSAADSAADSADSVADSADSVADYAVGREQNSKQTSRATLVVQMWETGAECRLLAPRQVHDHRSSPCTRSRG